jgi:hypothetical protein
MRTISLNEFTYDFMDISKKLTYAEIRMLYLLITEPEVRNITQQDFANKIETDRRTINIGLKNLRRFNYLSGINFNHIKIDADKLKYPDNKLEEVYKDVPTNEIVKNMKFIIGSYIDYYPDKKPHEIVVNEDFFNYVFGDKRLHMKLKYNKEFIIKTISERFPECMFCFNRTKDSYESESHYQIVYELNNQIVISRKHKRNKLNIVSLIAYLEEKHSIMEHQVLKVIKEDFPNIRIDKWRNLIIPKPWKD